MSYDRLFLISLAVRYVCIVSVFLLAIPVARKWWGKFGVKAFVAYYILRFVALFVLCKIGGAYPGDLPEWHSMSRWIVDEHLIPGLECKTGYHLGFSYVLALSTWIWNNPLSIAISWSLCEMVAMVLFFVSLRAVFSERIAKRTIILYLASPFCLFISWLGAQDEPFYLLIAALLLLLYHKGSGMLAQWYVSFTAIFFSKLIAPLFLMPFALMRRWKGLLPFIAGMLAYYCLCWAIGIDPFDMRTTKDMSDMRTLSMLAFETQLGNVWYFLDFVPVWLQNIVLLSVMGIVGLSLLPNFSSGGRLCDAFDNACVLHGALMLVLMLFFRINFVQYLLPMGFCLAFHMASGMDSPQSRRYRSWMAFWMCVIIFKDFVNNIVRRQLVFPENGDIVLDIGSIVYLLSTAAFAIAFYVKFRDRFHSPWRGLAGLKDDMVR